MKSGKKNNSDIYNIQNLVCTQSTIRKLATMKLKYFVRKSFKTLNPSVKLLWNWHIDYLCDVLEAVYEGKINRLIINIPPRYLKSIICSVSFPAWVLGKNPTKRIIVASYSKHLAIKHSMDARQLMMQKWYKKSFPLTTIAEGMNEKNKFITTKNGFRFATSVNATLTGEGGDILIVDDPHNPVGIYNKTNRKKTINWFTGVFSSRLNNKKNGAIIIVMQRLHVEDLSGFILSKDKNKDWFLISLPAIAEEKKEYYLFDKLYKIRDIGNVLHSKMENKNTIKRIKSELGEYNFSAQYQQNPVAMEGNMIKKSWLKYYNDSDFTNLFQKKTFSYYISVDCASGIGTENDFTAISIFFVENNKFFLKNMLRLKQPYPELKNTLIQIIEKYIPQAVIIEDKSNGSSMIQDLQQNYNNIIAIKPIKSKECRVNDILTTLEAGNFLINDNQEWTKELEIELLSFPACKHDDQVDSISQFINWYNLSRRNLGLEPHIRSL